MPQKQIMNLLRNWTEKKKTGQVEINFREGQIRNYTVRESFLVETSGKRDVGGERQHYQDKNA